MYGIVYFRLWVGCGPTMLFASLVTCSQCVTYFQMKSILLNHGLPDTAGTHLLSSVISGTVASIVINPVDVMKTRLMKEIKSSNNG